MGYSTATVFLLSKNRGIQHLILSCHYSCYYYFYRKSNANLNSQCHTCETHWFSHCLNLVHVKSLCYLSLLAPSPSSVVLIDGRNAPHRLSGPLCQCKFSFDWQCWPSLYNIPKYLWLLLTLTWSPCWIHFDSFPWSPHILLEFIYSIQWCLFHICSWFPFKLLWRLRCGRLSLTCF